MNRIPEASPAQALARHMRPPIARPSPMPAPTRAGTRLAHRPGMPSSARAPGVSRAGARPAAVGRRGCSVVVTPRS